MRIRKPDYYDRFKCIAGACKDSCCIGWEIDVDEEKQEIYRNADGVLGERLRTCIDWENGSFILQGEEERCPFLNKDNLCDLIIGLGEESLCEICREHPRFYDWFVGLKEVGVGLCCEAAARLVLEREEPTQFVEEISVSDEEEEDDIEDELVGILFKARETAFAILQDRQEPFWNRLLRLGTYIEELQDGLDFGSFEEVEESAEYYRHFNDEEPGDVQISYEEVLKLCRELEPIDNAWSETLENLSQLVSDPKELARLEREMDEQTSDREYEYEHLAVYFIFRYFMKCRDDGNVRSKGFLVTFCLILIRLLDIGTYKERGIVTKEDRAENAKTCSKEIEYSEENLACLEEAFWNCDSFLDLQEMEKVR